MERFQSAFRTVSRSPLTERVPFQTLSTFWPLGVSQLTDQPFSAVLLGLLTVTCAWKPPDQVFVTAKVASHGVLLPPPLCPTPVTSPLPPSKTTSEQP